MPTTKKEVYRSPWFDLEGYLACTVKYDDGSKGTVLAHREVMEQHLGRSLHSEEWVHHEDENKRNNVLGNLKLMSASAHAKHHAEDRPAPLRSFACPECGETFERLLRVVRHNQHGQCKKGPFCSRRCAGRYNQKVQARA